MEKEPLTNFIKAEDYHQDYLKKHPNGYCHIDVNQASYPVIDASRYSKPSDEEIKKKLSPEEYAVTQKMIPNGPSPIVTGISLMPVFM